MSLKIKLNICLYFEEFAYYASLFYEDCFLKFNNFAVEAELSFSPPKGDLPPMGGILVKMPPKCPP